MGQLRTRRLATVLVHVVSSGWDGHEYRWLATGYEDDSPPNPMGVEPGLDAVQNAGPSMCR